MQSIDAICLEKGQIPRRLDDSASQYVFSTVEDITENNTLKH